MADMSVFERKDKLDLRSLDELVSLLVSAHASDESRWGWSFSGTYKTDVEMVKLESFCEKYGLTMDRSGSRVGGVVDMGQSYTRLVDFVNDYTELKLDVDRMTTNLSLPTDKANSLQLRLESQDFILQGGASTIYVTFTGDYLRPDQLQDVSRLLGEDAFNPEKVSWGYHAGGLLDMEAYQTQVVKGGEISRFGFSAQVRGLEAQDLIGRQYVYVSTRKDFGQLDGLPTEFAEAFPTFKKLGLKSSSVNFRVGFHVEPYKLAELEKAMAEFNLFRQDYQQKPLWTV